MRGRAFGMALSIMADLHGHNEPTDSPAWTGSCPYSGRSSGRKGNKGQGLKKLKARRAKKKRYKNR